ncbi:hypothetical protein L6R52_14340 [Myxococcota bacterium]|nr:hypothetical protein [Myxococcota bacterium]
MGSLRSIVVSLAGLAVVLVACPRRDGATGPDAAAVRAEPVAPRGFFSDYFVFISRDDAPPLVVPVDLNWAWSDPTRVEYELKAWRGTARDPWPMFYLKEVRTSGVPPRTWPELEGTGAIQLARDGASITVERAADLGRVVIAVPRPVQSAMTREPFEAGSNETSATPTTSTLDGTPREGWLVHEHIELPAPLGADDAAKLEARFSRFHWIPVVSDEGRTLELYRVMGDGAHRATRWGLDASGTITATVTTDFTLIETESRPEATSGRTAVPVAWTIEARRWQHTIELRTRSGHTGHGETRPKGRALYQQLLVEGTSTREGKGTKAHGMVELILSD